METYEKILNLNNEFEANLLKEVLTDRQIPHGIIPAEDTALGGIMGMEYGWGYVEAPERYRQEITKLYKEISQKK